MKTTFLGLALRSPVVISSSPFTATARMVERCARHGAGAVVLKSIFEEQITREAAALDTGRETGIGMGDSGEYLERYIGDRTHAEYLELIRQSRSTGIPVIASINCRAADPSWGDYAREVASAGASALELNIFLRPTDHRRTSAEIESDYLHIARRVVKAIGPDGIPVAVKLPQRLTNFLLVSDGLLARGVRGVTLFNRYFEPDIDIQRLQLRGSDPYSHPDELRDVLCSTALCSTALPALDIAVSTGIHDGEAAVKALLCGARAVQICTAIHRSGFEVIASIDRFIDRWAEEHGFGRLDDFRGLLDYGSTDDDRYRRVQYLKFFPGESAAEQQAEHRAERQPEPTTV